MTAQISSVIRRGTEVSVRGGLIGLPNDWTTGDTCTVENLANQHVVFSGGSAQTVNGITGGHYILRGPGKVSLEKVSGGWSVYNLGISSVNAVESPDGTLSAAQNFAAPFWYNETEAVLIHGCTSDSDNGLYRRINSGSAPSWEKVGFGTIPSYTSQIVGTTTLNLTSGFANVQLTATDLDGSGSDYSITLASDRIEFDNTDGTKTYKVTYSMDVTSGSILAPIDLRAELDNVLVSRSAASIELSANQEATITKSFIVTPPTSASNNNFLDFLARQNDASADGAVVEILVLIERVA